MSVKSYKKWKAELPSCKHRKLIGGIYHCFSDTMYHPLCAIENCPHEKWCQKIIKGGDNKEGEKK